MAGSATNSAIEVAYWFICGENGFSEPNLAVMFAQGRPYMPPKKLSDKVSDFLGKVWKRYAPLSAKELNLMIKSNPAYQNCYISGAKNIAPHMPPQIRKFLIPRTDRWWFRNGIRVRFLSKSKRRKP